jgi:transcriptional regulator with XRE-family HTH domain
MPKRSGDPSTATDPAIRDLLGRVSSNVKRIRTARDLTQEEAAHRSGLATRVYVRVEHEESNFSASTLAKIAQGLDVDVGELVRAVRKGA